MLRELKFVQGAVAKKELLPAMTHFAIEKGFVRAYNGSLALCAPIDFKVDCKPKAIPLINAISQCEQGIELEMTKGGRLKVSSGSFKAFVDCIDEDTPHVHPEGERVEFNGDVMLRALKAVEPFIGTDASRVWNCGVLMDGESMFATNNVVAVEYWLGAKMPFKINVPSKAIDEMLRIDEPPTHAQVTENSITFHYADARWVRTQLYPTTWPDIRAILDAPHTPLPVDARVFEGMRKLQKFTDQIGRVYVQDGTLRTAPKGDLDEGAKYEVPGLGWDGIYNASMFLLLDGVATHADFTAHPKPCIWYGNNIRGAIIGMRL
jgi:DNA polymerase III sliding clamp (beta) subunit (PCNA family)